MKRFEIIMAGIGGQGLLLAGLILGDAAAIGEKKYAVQIESYAPLARGGSSSSELVISDDEIDYPRIKQADVLIALSKDALNAHKKKVRADGIILLNSTDVPEHEEDKRIIDMPLTAIAMETTGKAFTVSTVALGVVPRLTDMISINSIVSSLSRRAPTGTENLNMSAAEAGFAASEKIVI